ncbi:MAG: 30S ribosomal protein S12 methylthiotransferase RimO [Candidatus Omnitrophota bacterium]
MKKTFSIISLGCPRNLVDSEYIANEFKEKGFDLKDEAGKAHTVIINTCSFIEDAKVESIDTILKVIDAKKKGDVKRIIVAGCLPERYSKKLKKEFKEIDEFRGVLDFKATFKDKDRTTLTPSYYSYLKISEGCKNRCTYCIIPYLKGPYTSRPIGPAVEEARGLFKKNIKEIILVGQDTSLYGSDLYGKKRLAELLKKIDDITDGKWVRLLYCHPKNLGRDVLQIIKNSKNICKYIDLPIEHISSNILKRMGRKIKKSKIVALIKRIRDIIPGVALRTSFIVGFPGETGEDFRELVEFMKDVKFERLGIFKYSREEGTPAYKYKGQISEKIKEERFKEAMLIQQEVSREVNRGFMGRVMDVLIEEEKDGAFVGRTEYDAPEVDGVVYINSKDKKLDIGNFYKARIIDTYEYDLVGELYEPTE